MIETRTTGIDRVQRRLRAWETASAMQGVIRPLGLAYRDALVAATPRGEGPADGRTRLADAYGVAEQYTPRVAQVRITNTTPHLRYVLRGRGPIVARGRALRFVIGGRVLFRKRVGPAEPNNYPPRVRAQMDGQIRQARVDLRTAVTRAYRGGA